MTQENSMDNKNHIIGFLDVISCSNNL